MLNLRDTLNQMTEGEETEEELPDEIDEKELDKCNKPKKGGLMKFNEQDLTPEDLAKYKKLLEGQEELAKKYKPVEEVAKSVVADEIKSLREIIQKQNNALQEQAELQEVTNIAKGFEIITGASPEAQEKLTKSLMAIKKIDTESYENVLKELNACVGTVNKSMMFMEKGKTGEMTASDSNKAWSAIVEKSKELLRTGVAKNQAEAIEKAGQENPELLQAYENGMKGGQ
jgi:vacuolar-type H+-ATPase subunit I/STV1